MIPAVTTGGRSFKGAALYYLHDKRQAGEKQRLSANRVGWSSTVNLSTEDADRAWRIMADTAMSQGDLKSAAGEKGTGRKLTKPVFAYSLAWHPDETVTREEQIAAARESLKVQGLEDHQAIIVAHNDEPHAHVHILVNRVHPETGKAATLSNNTLKLSQWAEAYEKQRGKIYCDGRVQNNAKRQQGEQVREKRVSRPDYEFDRATANDSLKADFVRSNQEQKDAQLNAIDRAMQHSHERQWEAIKQAYGGAKDKIYDHAKRLKSYKNDDIKEAYKPKWKELFQRQRAEQEIFSARENGFLSRMFNTLSLVGEIYRNNDRDVMLTFLSLLNRSERQNTLLSRHEQERRELAAEVSGLTKQAIRDIDKRRDGDLGKLKTEYLKQCTELKQVQQKQQGQIKEAWKVRNAERRQAMAPFQVKQQARQQQPKQQRSQQQGQGRSRSAEDNRRDSNGRSRSAAPSPSKGPSNRR